MCGRFAVFDPIDILQTRFDAVVDASCDAYRPNWNVCPTQSVPVVIAEGDQRRLIMARWGFERPWAKGRPLINAQGETAATKRTFSTAFRQSRCLVPFNGFYEWRRDGKAKQPMAIARPGHDLMAMAGLWEWSPTEDDPDRRAFCVLTTAPNAVMQPIHDRMPVIPDDDGEATWMADDATGEALQALVTPAADDRLTAWMVSNRVNGVRNHDADCFAPMTA